MSQTIKQEDEQNKAAVFALGNFDGVHRGHQSVIRAAKEKAQALGVPACILTFEPHPRSVLVPDTPPFRLTPRPVKDRLLRELGVDGIVSLPFTLEFSNLSAEEFVRKILIKRLEAKHILAGDNYVFGHRRGGTMSLMREWLAPHSIGVTEISPFRDSSGHIISSSRTRELLQAGDVRAAAQFLGRDWSITGTIQHGAKRGTSIGVPTANIALGEYLRPKYGVYAVQATRLKDGTRHKGVANIGKRPTVDGHTELLEVHLFDFNETIYGEEWDMALIDFLRPEQAFETLDALRAQIGKDIEAARAILAV